MRGRERFQARHAIWLTCFLGTAHLRFQRRKLVDNCSSSELTWCYWPCPRLPQDLLLTPDLGRCHVENIPRILLRISVSPSDLLGRGTDLLSGRRCARDYRGGLGLTWTAVRQVPLAEEPPSRAVPVAHKILRHKAWKDFQDFHRYFLRNPYVGLQTIFRGSTFFGRRRKKMF